MAWSGLVVPTPTLFSADESLDPDANRTYLEGLVSSGVRHLFVLGSVGEFPSVTESERPVLLRSALASLREGTDLWVGVGAPATRTAVAWARAAAEAGASVVVAVPPYYLRPTEAAIASYYRSIHEAVRVPVFAYNIPTKVGYALSPELVHRLGRQGIVQGIKDTSGSAQSLLGFLTGAGPGFSVLPGDDVLARWAIGQGAAGAVMGTANVAPRLALALIESARQRDPAAGDELQRLVGAVVAADSAGPFPSTLKFLAHRLRGAPEGYRAPYVALTPAESEAVLVRFRPIEAELRPYR